MIYLLIPVPYILLFLIFALAFALFGMKAKLSLTLAAAVSLITNIALTLIIGKGAVAYAGITLGLLLASLPYILAAGIISFIPNAKAIIAGEALKPRRIVLSFMLAAFAFASAMTILNRFPPVIVPDEYGEFIDSDTKAEIRDSLRPESRILPYFIKVVKADENGWSAEATYLPAREKTGITRYRSPDGKVVGEYYVP